MGSIWFTDLGIKPGFAVDAYENGTIDDLKSRFSDSEREWLVEKFRQITL